MGDRTENPKASLNFGTGKDGEGDVDWVKGGGGGDSEPPDSVRPGGLGRGEKKKKRR